MRQMFENLQYPCYDNRAGVDEELKFFSMFSGIGGFDLPAIELGHSSVGHAEIDKYAESVYQRYFDNNNYGDVSKIDWKEVDNFEILFAGFPCQSFSIAGSRRGFEDTRGTLFFEVARCLEQKQPPYCVLENVRGLLSHDKGRTFETILNTLDEMGYHAEWEVCNSRYFGVPQNRERVFIVGYLRGQPRPEVFPLSGTDRTNIRKDQKQVTVVNFQTRNPDRPSLTRICDCGSGKLYKNCHGASGGSGVLMRDDGITYCLDSACAQGILEGTTIRKLTPLECERAQGFPDNWTKHGKDNEIISDSQRYKMCGNAVTVNVTRTILEKFN